MKLLIWVSFNVSHFILLEYYHGFREKLLLKQIYYFRLQSDNNFSELVNNLLLPLIDKCEIPKNVNRIRRNEKQNFKVKLL